ncbi:hypothetical protein SAMN06265376_104332 [Dokdonia pacifica]|uniref:Uncharacterized protein n=1 Tax=Dokdonia pacifica TaxID=1627892 RepID=A0A239ADE8_9FLAO|nr:hypothetical protein SAMN06265376_104332 [Dokdonia pacifica]
MLINILLYIKMICYLFCLKKACYKNVESETN